MLDGYEERQSSRVLDAVQAWAHPAVLYRELEAFTPCDENGAVSIGRVDGLLVPTDLDRRFRVGNGWCWRNRALVGVEVKVSRSDLTRGLRSQQLERYAGALAGLYVAVPKHLKVKPTELPDGVGLLVCDTFTPYNADPMPARCRRRATLRSGVQVAPELMWKLMFLAHQNAQREIREARARERAACRAAGREAARRLSALCAVAMESPDAE